MNASAKKFYETVRAALSNAATALSPKDYQELLDEVWCEIEARTEALKQDE